MCEAVRPTVQGILIEASPGQSHTMRIMRPAAVCVYAGVCSAQTSVHYAEGGEAATQGFGTVIYKVNLVI